MAGFVPFLYRKNSTSGEEPASVAVYLVDRERTCNGGTDAALRFLFLLKQSLINAKCLYLPAKPCFVQIADF